MSTIHHIAIAAVAVNLAGCSTMRVSTDYDANANFSGPKTYDWQWGQPKRTGDPRIDNALLDKRIRRAVDDELKAKGFVRDTSGAATYLVFYHAAISKELSVTQVNDYYGYHSSWRGGYVDVDSYDKGTIVLDIVEARSRQMIWRAWAEDTIEEGRTPEQREAKIREAVHKMLEHFPPATK